MAHPPGVFVDKDGSVDALAAGLIRRMRLSRMEDIHVMRKRDEGRTGQKVQRVEDSGDDSTCAC